ncbi:MAG: molybdenum cofactor guanylyltransferase [Verrucomicrobia bacterium]|nr:molybdenum cofactor guanylyltransferase [Verrucomicrobiota bacterium]
MGKDKAWLEMDGKPLLQLQIERMEAAGAGEILISGPHNRGYEKFGAPVIEDEVAGAGPLAGLSAGFAAARSGIVLALAIDLPRMKTEFLRWLLQQAEGMDAVCPESDRGFEPLCAVYRRSACLPIIKRRLAANQLALQGMMGELRDSVRLRVVSPTEWRVWGQDMLRNWNRP